MSSVATMVGTAAVLTVVEPPFVMKDTPAAISTLAPRAAATQAVLQPEVDYAKVQQYSVGALLVHIAMYGLLKVFIK